jgi:hypothetical protein
MPNLMMELMKLQEEDRHGESKKALIPMEKGTYVK